MNNKKYLLTNGTSITAGGGFEEYAYRKDVRDAYKEKGIELPDSMLECTYGYHLANHLGLELINIAKCGSGIDRLIRTTMDWLSNNEDKVKDTLFFFEFQPGIRVDQYVKEEEMYFIVNGHIDDKGDYHFSFTKEWYFDDWDNMDIYDKRWGKTYIEYLKKFWDIDEAHKAEKRNMETFLGYIEALGVDYFFDGQHRLLDEFNYDFYEKIKHKNIINALGDKSIWQYGEENKLMIYHEVDNNDNHVGYNGNKIIANKLANYIRG